MFANTSNFMARPFNSRFTLRKELEETRNIHCIYEIMKKHLSEKEKQHRERAAVTHLVMYLRTRDLELQNTRDTLKEVNGSPAYPLAKHPHLHSASPALLRMVL